MNGYTVVAGEPVTGSQSGNHGSPVHRSLPNKQEMNESKDMSRNLLSQPVDELFSFIFHCQELKKKKLLMHPSIDKK